MRRTLVLLFVLIVSAASATGVHASTDCERWLADYKKALAQKPSYQQLEAAKHRARALARRKIGQIVAATTPATPKPVRISSIRPRLTPRQMLNRFDVLCGDLPVAPANQVLDSRMAPEEFISELSLGPIDELPIPEYSPLLAETAPAAFTSTATPSTSPYAGGPVLPVYGPSFSGLASAPGTVSGPTGGTTSPGIPPTTSPVLPPTTVPVLPPDVPPVAAPVPELGTLLYVFTGLGGIAAGVRRRLRAR